MNIGWLEQYNFNYINELICSNTTIKEFVKDISISDLLKDLQYAEYIINILDKNKLKNIDEKISKVKIKYTNVTEKELKLPSSKKIKFF